LSVGNIFTSNSDTKDTFISQRFYGFKVFYLFSSDSLNVSPIVTILQGILGKDDRKWKLFIKFWRSWGHPSPYSSETEAELTVKAVRLFKLLDFSCTKSELLNTPKVKLIQSRRHFLLEACQCLLVGSGNEDLEMKGKKPLLILTYGSRDKILTVSLI
jgi:hypothetical protein